MAASKREHLIETALELFCRDGFHATGIDKILAEAGCAKMTLYNHFASKDDLILAVLRRRDETFRRDFKRVVEKRAKTPKGRLLAAFDALSDWIAGRGFNGCAFIKASAEYGDPRHPIHAAAAEHKRLMVGYLRGLADAAGARDPDALARGLMLLMEGATVMAHVTGDENAAADAKRSAETLLAAAGAR